MARPPALRTIRVLVLASASAEPLPSAGLHRAMPAVDVSVVPHTAAGGRCHGDGEVGGGVEVASYRFAG